MATDPRGARGYAHRRPGRDAWSSADEHPYAPAGGLGSDLLSHPNWTSRRDADARHAHADNGCRHADAIPHADPLPHANADRYAHAYSHPHADPYADADWNGHVHGHAHRHTHIHAHRLCNADWHTASYYRNANADEHPDADRHSHTDEHSDEHTNAHRHAYANPHEHAYANFRAASVRVGYQT